MKNFNPHPIISAMTFNDLRQEVFAIDSNFQELLTDIEKAIAEAEETQHEMAVEKFGADFLKKPACELTGEEFFEYANFSPLGDTIRELKEMKSAVLEKKTANILALCKVETDLIEKHIADRK